MLPSFWTLSQKASSTKDAFVKMLNRLVLCFSASLSTSSLRTSGSPPVSMNRWVPRSSAWLTRLSISSYVRFRRLP